MLHLLDPLLLEDIQNPEHPSDFIARDSFVILVLRLPELKDNIVYVVSYAFVIQEDRAYIYERQENRLKELGSLVEMNEFLDSKTDDLIKEIKQYHYEIDELEESLYEAKLDTHFMQKWLVYKKDISLIYRLLFQAELSFELFISHHKRKKSSSFEELAYADIYEHFKRIQDLAQVAIDKLNSFYDFYRAKVDEKMNKNVYYLTLLSGIFLPLTLITGFFGMNTGGLLWLNDPYGTWKAIGVAFVLEIIFFLPFLTQNMKKIKRHKR